MRLLEHEAKRLFREAGISVPAGSLLRPDESPGPHLARLPFPRMVKVQIPRGGRGRAGGIRRAETPAEAAALCSSLFSAPFLGYPVEALLCEEVVPALRECYLGVTYDAALRSPLLVLSPEGGIEVEETVASDPASVIRIPLDPLADFHPFQAREAAGALSLEGENLLRLAELILHAVQLFRRLDALLLEVNPVALTGEGSWIALDGHIEIDDDARYRHPELTEVYRIPLRESGPRPATAFERQAEAIDRMDHRGVAGRVIEFPGDLGILIGGGGASLTAFDALLRHGAKPANYCELGGNPTVKKVAALTQLILSREGVRRLAVIMNVVSNTRADLVARGVLKGILELGLAPADVLAVFRIPGAWEDEAAKILAKYDVPLCDRTVSIDEAARRAAQHRVDR